MEQDKSKLDYLRSYARTAVIDNEQAKKLKPDVVDKSQELSNARINLFSADVLNNIQDVPKVETVNIEPVVQEAQKKDYRIADLLMAKQNEKNQAINNEINNDIDEEIENKTENLITDNLFSSIDDIEPENGEDVVKELSSYTQKRAKGMQFRVKLLTGILCSLIALFGGWVIGNTVSIAQTSSQIATEKVLESEYQVNLAKYLTKIANLDNQNQEKLEEDGTLIPIEEIIPITPVPLTEPTNYQKETNWFDKICNWFLHLFGG